MGNGADVVEGAPTVASESIEARAEGEPATLAEPTGAEGSEPREERDGRRRRGGRGRRERRDITAPESGAVELDAEAAPHAMIGAEVVAGPEASLAPVAEAMPPAPAEPVAAPPVVAAARVAAPAPAPAVVAPFVLPTDTLGAMAESAGLQWVHSDAERVRAAQAAMAAEPKPIHVPRERPPVVRMDEGPLVLVETRKDLSQIKLPFDASA
jgi:ribonuclease E